MKQRHDIDQETKNQLQLTVNKLKFENVKLKNSTFFILTLAPPHYGWAQIRTARPSRAARNIFRADSSNVLELAGHRPGPANSNTVEVPGGPDAGPSTHLELGKFFY